MSEPGAEAESAPWVKAHAEVLEVARERAGLEGREGACLLRAFREDVHRHLGYGDFPEYSDRQLGYGHRTTQDKLRTAEALERLPELARALQQGQLHASAVRELTRVATPETEAGWIAAATGRRMREIERLVAGRARGDRPNDTQRPELARHVLRFEVSGETLAAFRDAMAWLRDQSGEALDDDAALLMLARSVLCGAGAGTQPDAPAKTEPTAAQPAATEATTTEPSAAPPAAAHAAAGRSKYQIRLTVCERCGRGTQRAGADSIEVEPAMVDAARCDATISTDAAMDTSVPTWTRWINRFDRKPSAALT